MTGPAARQGLHLKFLLSEMTNWKEWRQKHPDTAVLSKQTGHLRNYDVSAYQAYFADDQLMFPVRRQKKRPERFRNKEPMIVVSIGDKWKAYAVSDIAAVAGAAATS